MSAHLPSSSALERELWVTRDLFRRNFRIVRIDGKDARGKSDHLLSLCHLLIQNEVTYPEIEKWIKKKVIPGLLSGERAAFVGYERDKPVASAVIKRGDSSKFCHLKIADNFQDLNIGEVFFSLMAIEARTHAKEVHFTLPESLWELRGSFFRSFGFLEARPAHAQYRLFERELRCSAAFNTVWLAAQSKLSKLLEIFDYGDSRRQLLMSIRPRHAERILKKEKTVEIRKRFAQKWRGHRVSLYASNPVRALVGEATIATVAAGHPSSIWEKFNSRIGVSKAEFDQYVGGASQVYAISFEDVEAYNSRVSVSQMSDFVGQRLIPPQSYCSLRAGGPWAEAVSVATMMNEALGESNKGRLSL